MLLVTGAAGFIGNWLCERLARDGYAVRAVDCLTDYYDASLKKANLDRLLTRPDIEFVDADLATLDLGALLDDVEVVFHLAGEPGVRASWGSGFEPYLHNNVRVTQQLLEACRHRPVHRFVYASSSSIYGHPASVPTSERVLPAPVSPYGVSKLAAEHLCELYRVEFRVPTTSLRLFTVYGPRQRPDMAFSRLVRAALDGEPFPLYGDGTQRRDFTYVDDVVDAFVAAAERDWSGVANIGGGAPVTLLEAIGILEELCGPIALSPRERQPGDSRETFADISAAEVALGYRPTVSLYDGLARMVAWAEREDHVLAP